MIRACLSVVVASLGLLALPSWTVALDPLPPERYTWEIIDVPLAGTFGQTAVVDMNDHGTVVGYTRANQLGTFSFLRTADRRLVALPCPGGHSFEVASINNRDEVAGTCLRPSGQGGRYEGLILTPLARRQSATPVTSPEATWIFVHGSNDHGQVVGFYYDLQGGGPHPYWNVGNAFRPVPVTHVQGTPTVSATFRGLNNWGTFVGDYERPRPPDGGTGGPFGLFYYRGTGWDLRCPAALSTHLMDLNDGHEMVGICNAPTGGHSFLITHTPAPWSFFAVQVPGPDVVATDISGMNNRGQLVGRVLLVDPNDPNRLLSKGFIATPVPAGFAATPETGMAAHASGPSVARREQTPQAVTSPIMWNTSSCDEGPGLIVPLRLRQTLGCDTDTATTHMRPGQPQ